MGLFIMAFTEDLDSFFNDFKVDVFMMELLIKVF